ncbi:hypothetical protein Patl1_13775 [Pistacia atlantica]|uniref:Uncharacterized protein n=1 Tax=Pistacia atlantica TaxID=434234 RepID=A0ACC1AT47_9ROSI|nr:hypothetical protein Patl1_13775 [Pistacia atlantica]
MQMAPLRSQCNKKEANRGAWTAEEDQKLAQVIEIHGPKRWRSVAAKAEKTSVEEGTSNADKDSKYSLSRDEFLDCYNEPLNLEWMSRFFEMDESWFHFA